MHTHLYVNAYLNNIFTYKKKSELAMRRGAWFMASNKMLFISIVTRFMCFFMLQDPSSLKPLSLYIVCYLFAGVFPFNCSVVVVVGGLDELKDRQQADE